MKGSMQTAYLHGISIGVFVLGFFVGQLNRSGNNGLLYHYSLRGHGVTKESLDAALMSVISFQIKVYKFPFS